MSIQRWDPLRDMLSLREAMNHLLEESFVRPRAGMTAMTSGMAMDVKETHDSYVLETGLPGFKPEDVEISILNDTLRIKAESRAEEEREDENWLLRERRHGQFERTITLPTPVSAETANAEFDNGILRITLPKSEEARAKTIPVRASHSLGSGQSTTTNSEVVHEIPVGGESGVQDSERPGE